MLRAKLYLAILAYVFFVNRFLNKPLRRVIAVIQHKFRHISLLLTSLFRNSNLPVFSAIRTNTHVTSLGLQNGSLVQSLRI